MASGPNAPAGNVGQKLLGILEHLQTHVNSRMHRNSCILGLTKKHTGWHYKVPNGKPPVFAWASMKTRGRNADAVKRPCVSIGIHGDLLTEKQGTACGLLFKRKANWGEKGPGEWEGVAYAIGDTGYKSLQCGLTTAAKECLRRAGG